MRILSPHKISTEIIDIIYEAKEKLIIVSPYVNFTNWDRLAQELRNALKRGVKIDFYVRNEPENAKSWEQVQSLGITPKLVQNLHAKFYLNEKNGVISSMNLLGSSNSNSIEIGCKLETEQEVSDLIRFVTDFVHVNETSDIPTDDDLYLTKEKFMVVLENYLSNVLKSRVWSKYQSNGAFEINAISNRFTLGVDKLNNTIAITAVLSGKESETFSQEGDKHFFSSYFEYDLFKGGNGHLATITAFSKVRLSNSFLDHLRVNEKKMLLDEIANFFVQIGNFKAFCWNNKRDN